jgi:hypothetical protein
LIALAIVAAMTAGLIDAAAGDARTRAAVRERREALMLAQSALDRSYDPNAPDGGAWRAYSWRVSHDSAGPPDAFDRHPLERLNVEIDRAGQRILRLGTVRARP